MLIIHVKINQTIVANLFILFLHMFMYLPNESITAKTVKTDEINRKKYTLIIITSSGSLLIKGLRFD